MTDEQFEALQESMRQQNETLVSLNNNIVELQQYIAEQDRNEQEEKAQQEKEKVAEKEQSEYESEQAELLAEQRAGEDAEQAETYETILAETRDNINLNNHIIVGQICFMGIIAGILIGKILWDRFFKA